MSNESTFTPIGTEATKLIFKILEEKSVKAHDDRSFTKVDTEMHNDNAPTMDWNKARQLNLFDFTVGR